MTMSEVDDAHMSGMSGMSDEEPFLGWNLTLEDLVEETRRMGRQPNLGTDSAMARARCGERTRRSIAGVSVDNSARSGSWNHDSTLNGHLEGLNPGVRRTENVAAASVSEVHDAEDEDEANGDADSDGNSAKAGSDLSTCPTHSVNGGSPSPSQMVEEDFSNEAVVDGEAGEAGEAGGYSWENPEHSSAENDDTSGKIYQRLNLVAGKLRQEGSRSPESEGEGRAAGEGEQGIVATEGGDEELGAAEEDRGDENLQPPLKRHKGLDT